MNYSIETQIRHEIEKKTREFIRNMDNNSLIDGLSSQDLIDNIYPMLCQLAIDNRELTINTPYGNFVLEQLSNSPTGRK